jgi:hypothetical protein
MFAGCLVLLAALGCTPSSSGSPPSEPTTSEPTTSEPTTGEPTTGEPTTGGPAEVRTCHDCPEAQLFCNAETSTCVCDVNGKVFPRGQCPATGAADPSPPADCRPSDWFCNLSGDCRCAR